MIAEMQANPDEFDSVASAFSIVDVPWERRMQTAAVASFVFALPLTMCCMLVVSSVLANIKEP